MSFFLAIMALVWESLLVIVLVSVPFVVLVIPVVVAVAIVLLIVAISQLVSLSTAIVALALEASSKQGSFFILIELLFLVLL
jgi:hypothetical protein